MSTGKNAAPKISVIVPVYNVKKYLRRCLESIRAQTFTEFECICVDDGSPDGSPAICDEYAKMDSRVRVIHQENAGVSAARNAGLDVACGEYVCFVDSDDWVERNFFENVLILAKPETDIVKSGYRIVKQENILKEIFPCEHTEEEQVSAVHTSCHFIKRNYLSKHNIKFPEGITLAEDWFFNYQLALYNPSVEYLNKITYNYFQNDSSVMHTLKRKNIDDEVSIIKTAENSFPKDGELILLRKFDVRSKILHIMQDFALYRKTFPECKREWFKRTSFKGKILFLIIEFHLDFLASIALKIKNIGRNK